ncbi:amino acid adenylation domain-containing protein [Streptomyces ficellus]|uniref:Amino acid adenylation domain-containing protein n=1 Tax=Streptomyces ficellus TaxID=1977088 RepID=A0ABT7Z632_9ACTN|nr:amino acid adenylation domain-containing protein [Streptomyces ficellus]MDN3294945.1 amino acid adenylation domain-containing protein [Streptomyces ficellus]
MTGGVVATAGGPAGTVRAPRADEPPTGAAGPSLIHEAVERHARCTPDAVALVDGDTRVPYADLNAAADAWAAELRDRGAGPGGFVPVLLPRSATLVAAILGVLKTGAAYAALDPEWPVERLRSVARVLAPEVTVADGSRDGWEGPVWSPPARGPRGAAEQFRGRPVGPGRQVDGTSPAAVFFTSGTTGRPKAVVSGHRATVSLFDGGFEPFHGGPVRPVMPQAAPVSWDGFTLETWGPLINGGTSVLLAGGYLMPGTLRALIEREGVNTVWLTASLFHLLLDEDPDCFEGLRHVLTGGERLSVPRVSAFLDRHPAIALTNGYGPVETCVFATARRVRRADCDVPSGIPVGVPVPGRRVHVLTDGRPAEPGTTGEICVSGDGVALGYLGDEELTARMFPTVALDGVPTRVYRTGDLGFQDTEGVLHFAGRADRQVKVRGHRVEPEEIEAVVRALPGVADCAVVPVAPAPAPGPGPAANGDNDDNGGGGGGGGFERLALFYTAATEAADALPPQAVRRELAGRLPRHLVPDLVRRQADLPLTANGKLDRAALLRTLRPGNGTEADA